MTKRCIGTDHTGDQELELSRHKVQQMLIFSLNELSLLQQSYFSSIELLICCPVLPFISLFPVPWLPPLLDDHDQLLALEIRLVKPNRKNLLSVSEPNRKPITGYN